MNPDYEKIVKHQHQATYEYDGVYYKLYYYSFGDFQKLLKHVFPNTNRVRRLGTRGFTDGEFVYLLSKDYWYARVNHETLIIHEIGHILGYKHRWIVPDVMHPFWLFRWSRYHW